MHVAFLAFFFFNDTATTEIYTLSLHDALPISARAGGWTRRRGSGATSSLSSSRRQGKTPRGSWPAAWGGERRGTADPESTRLDSHHVRTSYDLFCLAKKTIHQASPRVECQLSF